MRMNNEPNEPVEILMWTNDAFSSPCIVTARTRIEAAHLLARHLERGVDEVMSLYTPIEVDAIKRITPDQEAA